MNDVARANYIIARHPEIFLDAKFNMMNHMFLVTFWSGRKTWMNPSDIVAKYGKEEKTKLNVDDLLDLYNIAKRIEDEEMAQKCLEELRRKTE